MGISSSLRSSVHLGLGTKMNRLDFEVKRSKVKVTTRPNTVKKALWNFEGRGFSRSQTTFLALAKAYQSTVFRQSSSLTQRSVVRFYLNRNKATNKAVVTTYFVKSLHKSDFDHAQKCIKIVGDFFSPNRGSLDRRN